MITVDRATPLIRYNVTLTKGEIYRLPTMFSQIRVLAGCAWITYTGEDIVLREGQSATFDHHRGAPVVSAASKDPLVLELPA